nr:integrase, catalytic region, zinc finger, CCHC-type, peptidase aspartic, catalytic [Tanacetum cinerariifolium]
MPNNSQVKLKKIDVEEHPRMFNISKKTKSVTACNNSLNSRTLNVKVVCATCGICVFNSNHDTCVSEYLNDVNARTKKPSAVPISARKPKNKANKFVATPLRKTVASDITIQQSQSYFRKLVYYVKGINHNLFSVGQFCDADLEVAFQKSTCFVRDLQGNDLLTDARGSDLYTISLQETSSSSLICLIAKASPTQACPKRVASINEKKYILASDYDNSDPAPPIQNVSPLADTPTPSQQELDLLFGALYDEFFTAGITSVNKSSSPTKNYTTKDTVPTTNTPTTTDHAEENNNNQAEDMQLGSSLSLLVLEPL